LHTRNIEYCEIFKNNEKYVKTNEIYLECLREIEKKMEILIGFNVKF
jgi:hypothetical protein